jgi:uncharacterized protein YutE (UPF0331/DUF86 family)
MAKDVNKMIAQKLETVKDRSIFIKENFTTIQEVREDRIVKKALYKEYQELAEAAADICAMVLKEEGRLLKDDYTNFDALKFLFGAEMVRVLKRANGLRNVLVHEYSGIIDGIALESMEELLPSFEGFVEVVKRWLEKR